MHPVSSHLHACVHFDVWCGVQWFAVVFAAAHSQTHLWYMVMFVGVMEGMGFAAQYAGRLADLYQATSHQPRLQH